MSWSGHAKWRAKVGGVQSLATGLALALVMRAEPLHAEPGQEQVKTGMKGTVGLTLLGAETVLVVEAAIGVRKPWIYALGGAGGAVAGLVGGRYVDRAGNAEVSMTLLVSGILLAIPTTIAVLNASAYRPPQNPVVDAGNTTSFLIDSNMPEAHGMLLWPLVGLGEDGHIRLQVPSFDLRPVFSMTARKIHSLPSATQFEVSVFGLTF